MRIIEQWCRGKRDDQSLNEDGLVVTDDFAAVVDGVTSKSVLRLWHPSGGVVARSIVLDAIVSLPGAAAMRDGQKAIDARLRDRYRERGEDVCAIMDREPVERLQANAVVYSVRRREAWLFGDCQIMVNGVRIPTTKRGDELLGELRAFTALALREQGGPVRSPDPAREMIVPFLRLQTRFANRRGPYGYFVFDGYTDPDYPVRTVRVDPGDEVVLASDGYPLLAPTLEASERELRRLQREDPDLIGPEYRSTKGFAPGFDSFDDRTYLRFVA